ncbi:MAG: hypothetical protein AAFY01_06785 [Pseudomonadota bacterium]
MASVFTNTGKIVTTAIVLALFAGLGPVAFNLAVDPYDRAPVVDLDLYKEKVSEKAHYPLWKMLRYREREADLVVLGDSRARALRDKYWHELGAGGAFNFAYGGANIDEIHATFEHIKTDPEIRTLVVGIQLRSFDINHKAGQNRVPEAIRLAGNPLEYYSSWFVSKIGWRNLAARYPDVTTAIADLRPRLVQPASAATLASTDLARISESCGCVFLDTRTGPYGRGYLGRTRHWDGLDHWSGLFDIDAFDRDLPRVYARQVTKNARSDWRSFNFEEQLWDKVAAIADWASQNDIRLIFVIPPTITEMQQQIANYGQAEANLNFRLRLAHLAPVVDFDFDNHLTRDLSRFTDAYHFNSKVARLLVGETLQVADADSMAARAARQARADIACPVHASDQTREISDDLVTMREGTACRIWRAAE